MPYCPDCGVEVGEEAAFCRSCGSTLDEPPAADVSAESTDQSTTQVTTTSSSDDDTVHTTATTTGGGAPSAATETATLPEPDRLRTRLQGMDDYEFEHFVADLWERMGWQTSVSQASNDAGIDVVAEKETPYPQKKVIQAKRYSDSTTVGGPDIQQYASLRHQEPDADSVVVVTTSRFTSSAEERAADLNVKLVDGDDLVQMTEELDAVDLVAEYLTIRSEPATTTANKQASTTIEADVEEITQPETSPSETGKYDGTVDAKPLTNWDKWHWVAAVTGFVTFAAVGGGVFGPVGENLLFPGLIITGAVLYIDILRVREISEWNPTAWFYLAGLVLAMLTVPLYLINRARHVGL